MYGRADPAPRLGSTLELTLLLGAQVTQPWVRRAEDLTWPPTSYAPSSILERGALCLGKTVKLSLVV